MREQHAVAGRVQASAVPIGDGLFKLWCGSRTKHNSDDADLERRDEPCFGPWLPLTQSWAWNVASSTRSSIPPDEAQGARGRVS